MRIYDVSVPVHPAMVIYPGDAGVSVTPVARMDRGDVADVSALSFGTHTGTHIDPPSHFIPGGETIDQIPLEVMVGPCIVVDAEACGAAITRAFLQEVTIPTGTERLLFKTRNSTLWKSSAFAKDFVYIDADAACWLVEQGARLVGIDYLSVEQFGFDKPETHTTLLGAGVVVVEGLDLSQIPPGRYTLLCLPLNLKGGDGAPARVILVDGPLS